MAMHKLFRERLESAEGRSEFIVAVVADIRGFSAFSTHHESVETAVYIKRVYTRMIDDYFPGASFYKPTGDGMLITMPYTYTEESLRQAAQAAVGGCLRCVEEFPTICQGDPMINFEVPAAIGFGVARGPACCIASGEVVLDYSGHLLNLASRLMDLARPRGIVIDGAFGAEVLLAEQQELFEEEQVYLPSVSEETPRAVYIQKGVVELSEAARRPLSLEQWERIEVQRTVREWRLALPRYRVRLPKTPKRLDGIRATIFFPMYRKGKRVRALQRDLPAPFSYELEADRAAVMVDVDQTLALLSRWGVPRTAATRVVIEYVPE